MLTLAGAPYRARSQGEERSMADSTAPKRKRRRNKKRRPKPLPTPLPLLLSIEQAAQALGMARSTTYLLVQDDTLKSVVLAGRRMVPAAALTELVDKLRAQPVPPFAPATSVRKRREQRNGVAPP